MKRINNHREINQKTVGMEKVGSPNWDEATKGTAKLGRGRRRTRGLEREGLL